MRLSALQLVCLLILTNVSFPQTAAGNRSQSLRYSCVDDDTFLSVSASAPRHDSFVNVELSLVDPQGRTAGRDRQGESIPRSQYGKVVEIPTRPDNSKAIAVEVCRAMPGAYLVSVSEHGKFDYRLTVRGENKTVMEAEPVNLHADGDRVCHFRFDFQPGKGKAVIQWVDRAGHPLPFLEHPTCEVVPRA